MVFQLTRRARGNLEKPMEFSISASATAFCNVCSDGRGTSPHLGSQSEQLLLREAGRHSINVQSCIVCLAPNLQIPEILHSFSLVPSVRQLPRGRRAEC